MFQSLEAVLGRTTKIALMLTVVDWHQDELPHLQRLFFFKHTL